MSIADELAKPEELRRQRVISKEEFEIAKKKVLSDDDDVISHGTQVEVDTGSEFSALDFAARKPKTVDSTDKDRFSTQSEVGDALDDMAERELQAERQRDESRAGGRERQRRDDRDILGEIASLDRQWELERDDYKVTGQHGHQYTPTKGGSVFAGVAVATFGIIIWTAMAFSMAGGFILFPLFGVVMVCFGVGVSIWSYNKADSYERAQRRYRKRRRKLENERR